MTEEPEFVDVNTHHIECTETEETETDGLVVLLLNLNTTSQDVGVTEDLSP
jgi:hypothetical protein